MDPVSRRQFVTGLAAGGVLAGIASRPLLAAIDSAGRPNYPQTLTGPAFQLAIGELPVNFTGRARIATVVNGSLPAPVLRFREGDAVSIKVANRLNALSAIHWHGMVVPAAMDGVPGLSFDGIEPGGSYDFTFQAKQSGTYWYHAHAGYQEQSGLYGPIIIDPREPEAFAFNRDYVVMLSDWSDLTPEHVVSLLKKQSGYFNYNQRTLADFMRDVRDSRRRGRSAGCGAKCA